jgi:hypothetical protein
VDPSWLLWGFGLLGLVSATSWFAPHARSAARAFRRASSFTAFARARQLSISEDPRAHRSAPYLPTVMSVYGPFGDMYHVIEAEVAGEAVTFFEYRFGRRDSRWTYKRSALPVVFALGRPLPLFTLAPAPAKGAVSRKTEHKAAGKALFVQAIGDRLELWTTERDRKRARKLITQPLLDALAADPGWSVRASQGFLLVAHERGRFQKGGGGLGDYFDQAVRLRTLLRG